VTLTETADTCTTAAGHLTAKSCHSPGTPLSECFRGRRTGCSGAL